MTPNSAVPMLYFHISPCAGYGHVTTISSVAGLFGSIKLVDYCASKFAVMGLVEALRFEIMQEVRYNYDGTVLYSQLYKLVSGELPGLS